MARPSELFTWATYESRVRAWLGVSADYDAQLEEYTAAAADLADSYLGREDFETLPRSVVVGCLSAARVLWERRDTIDVSGNRLITAGSAAEAALVAASQWWGPYRSAEAL